jgi:hypothetical protein
MGVLVVIVLLALVVWLIFTQTQARRQQQVSTLLGRTGVLQAVDEVFGKTWKRVQGPGYVNLKPMLRAHAPMLSIDVETNDGGGSDVDIWMSAFSRRYGAVAHAQLIWRKKRQLASRLSNSVGSTTFHGGPRTPSASQGAPTRMAGSPAARPRPGAPATGDSGRGSAPAASGGSPANARVYKVLSESDCSFIVRTRKTPREIVQVVERTLGVTQRGSLDHLLFGPPRATMWAYVLEGSDGDNLLAISLVTKDDPDRDFVETSVRVPLQQSALAELDGSLENPPKGSRAFEQEIHARRVVPVDEYA